MFSRPISIVFSLCLAITTLILVGCSTTAQTPTPLPINATDQEVSLATPTLLPSATLTATSTPVPTITATMTLEPTATHIPLTDLDLTTIVLQIDDLPTGFYLWKKFSGDIQVMQSALTSLGEYNKKGEPFNYATVYSSEMMEGLQSGIYYTCYRVINPFQILSYGILLYDNESNAAHAYQALTADYEAEGLNFPVLGNESSGFTFTNPVNLIKIAGAPGRWVDQLNRLGIPKEVVPATFQGTRLIWRYHEALLHLILLSAEPTPLEETLALAQIMQNRIESNP